MGKREENLLRNKLNHKREQVKQGLYKPTVLVVTDIDGWAMDNAAHNFIPVLADYFNFTKVAAEDFEDRSHLEAMYNDYDVVYIMLPSYLPSSIRSDTNIITSFHGGPATEGQADAIDRAGLNHMKISYVSTQVKDRVTVYEWKSNRRVGAPLKPYVIDEQKLLSEQRLDKESVSKYQIDPEFSRHPQWHVYNDAHLPINLHVWRKGFDLTNLYFTPYGVNANEYKSDKPIQQKKFACGYAGWAKYIRGNQKEHRRIHWIFEAMQEVNFDLHFAGGLKQYAGDDIDTLKRQFEGTRIFIDSYTREEIHNFYTKINCYLVPDKWAGGPMPVLEAGLFGIPSVAQRGCGLVGDTIEHMKTGYLVDSKEEFFEGIKFMRENPEKRIEMGQNFKEYLLKNRSWQAVSKYWRRFIYDI